MALPPMPLLPPAGQGGPPLTPPPLAMPMMPPSGTVPQGGVLPMPGGRPTSTGAAGALQVASNAQIDAAQKAEQNAVASATTVTEQQATGLAAFVTRQWEMMNRWRQSSGVSDRLLTALRTFNGQYDPGRLSEIQRFGGSDVFARITPQKCRGATSLLRDIYISNDMPWAFAAPDDVAIPPEVLQQIETLVSSEIRNLAIGEQQGIAKLPSKDEVHDRTMALIEAARIAAKKRAGHRTQIAQDKVQTLLTKGNFYQALAAFLADITIFPYAVLKGPTVRMVPAVQWANGVPFVDIKPTIWFERVSPFDIWMTPGVTDVKDGAVIERRRFTRAALNDLLDLPGYDHAAIKRVLTEYSRGLTDVYDSTESSRADLESRENPTWNESGLIDGLEFHGNVQGCDLIDAGMPRRRIPDPMRDYACVIWKIGRHIIKIQLSPSPRKRHAYFASSFEKVPGTPIGNALPDMMADVQEMANVAFRALANNMAFASGPQVTVDDAKLSPGEDGESFYPWKRWHTRTDPFAPQAQSVPPIGFFQPADNSSNLMAVFQWLMQVGDDVSAVPRYVTSGSGVSGGAGRTASGLAMLMGNASKVLQTVAGNIDADVIEPLLTETKDLVLLTDETDMMDGTENVVAKGVAVAMQRETMRSRQLEFLQITQNPLDAQIMGPKGRAAVLRSVSTTLGMPGDEIVPSEEDIAEQEETAKQQAAATNMPGHGGLGEAAGAAAGKQPPQATQDMGPRQNTVQPRIAGGVG